MNMHRRLQALIARNQKKAIRAYRIEAKPDAAEATVYLYDLIDPFWGVSAAQFAKDLSAITAPTIHLRINSPGGDVFEGRAIATAIRGHQSKVIAHIDGLAASAASFIALAADEVEIGRGAMMMIHRAWGWAMGNAAELRETADVLEKIDESLVAEYVAETGNDEKQIREWLDAETWFSDQEAVEHGFADRISGAAADEEEEEDGEAPEASNLWDLSAYERAPVARAAAAPAPAAVDPEPIIQALDAWLSRAQAALQPAGTPAPVHNDAEREDAERRFRLVEHRIA